MAKDMKLVPLALPPGLYKNGTLYQAKGRWFDGNLVRFIDGTIRPVGGWRRAQDANGVKLPKLDGVPRAVISWRGDSGDVYTALGSTAGLFILLNGVVYDITPAGFTPGDPDPHFAGSAGDYGAGVYGAGDYGRGSTSLSLTDPDTWSLEQFGNWLVGVSTSERLLRVWQNDVVADAATAAGSPQATAVVVTPEQFVMLLGADDVNGRNVRNVGWASQGTVTVWNPLSTNSAGAFELSTNGKLVAGRRARGETLLWTDTDLWKAIWVGGQYDYRFDQAGSDCGTVSPNGMVVRDGIALWMGSESFYQYDGRVQPIPCDVADFVFSDFNRSVAAKVAAVHIATFGEVWWFYASAGATENDRVVIYNYRENHWSVGFLDRSCGFPAGATTYPIMCAADGAMFEHEVLHLHPVKQNFSRRADGTYVADGASPAGEGTIEATVFLESGPFELGEGDQVLQVQRLVPDAKDFGDVDTTFYGAFNPTAEEVVYGPFNLTQPTDVRFTARQVRVRLSQVLTNGWRVGLMRLGIVPRGQR